MLVSQLQHTARMKLAVSEGILNAYVSFFVLFTYISFKYIDHTLINKERKLNIRDRAYSFV